MLIVTSSEVYGRRPRPAPIREGDAMYPDNPYAVSKMAADYHALLYARRYGMPIMTARPDNHTGSGQSDQFVTTSFASQLAAMARGQQEPVLHVGNLKSRRNFTDVRDTVAAYRLILEQGHPGEAYNIAAKEAVTIQSVLDGLCDIAKIQPTIEIDPKRYRPEDATPDLDTTRLRALGWEPRIPLSQTLTDIYNEAAQAQ
jgi:GDP-4-dehydro-6-deoxy-D-mannose reductase